VLNFRRLRVCNAFRSKKSSALRVLKSISFFKGQILSQYVLNICLTILPLASIPVFIFYLGTDQFALFVFSSLLLALLTIWDGGASQALIRETVALVHSHGSGDHENSRPTVDCFVWFFLSLYIIIGLVILLLGYLFSATIVDLWIKPSPNLLETALIVVRISIATSAISIPALFIKSYLIGTQQILPLNALATIPQAIKYALGLSAVYFTQSAAWAVSAGLAASVIDLILKFYLLRKSIVRPSISEFTALWRLFRPDLLQSLLRVVKMSLVTSVGVLAVQSDKILASFLAPPLIYSSFTIASTISSSFLLILQPVATVYYPVFVRKCSNVLSITQNTKILFKLLLLASLALLPFFYLFIPPFITIWLQGSQVREVVVMFIGLLTLGTALNICSWSSTFMLLTLSSSRNIAYINLASLLLGVVLVLSLYNSLGPIVFAFPWLILNLVSNFPTLSLFIR
jgi:O-antigen/teichoic acid export membrane protein